MKGRGEHGAHERSDSCEPGGTTPPRPPAQDSGNSCASSETLGLCYTLSGRLVGALYKYVDLHYIYGSRGCRDTLRA
eukprot:3284176-Pyramimonas_sp.AAC.1